MLESAPILTKILEICQESQTDIKGLGQKIDLLENVIKKQKEEIQRLNNGKLSKNDDTNWIEVCI